MLQARWLWAALLGAASGMAAASQSCADFGGSNSGAGGYSQDVSSATGSGGSGVVIPDGDTPPQRVTYAALCGVGNCTPGPNGDPNVCTLSAATSTAVSASSSGVGGASNSSSGSVASSSTAGNGGAGGASNGSGGASMSSVAATGTSGTGPSAGTGESSSLGCQVLATGSSPTSACAPLGSGASGAVCQSSADCAFGLGCTTDPLSDGPSVSLCKPYCCGDFEDCPTNSYCAKENMAENPYRQIPVCTKVAPCQLLTDGACLDDQTCAVVRADGTTSCVAKGVGQFCDACPCAPGFQCSATGVCQKLCHTTSQNSSECGTGTCQGGSTNFPSGIGLCVGGLADCSHK